MNLQLPLKSAFVALPLEGSAKQKFQQLQHSLSPYSDVLRFQNPVTPHITIQFWKTLLEIELQQVRKQMKIVASKTASFDLRIIGVDTFAHKGEEKVLYCTVEFSGPLALLRKRCPWVDDKPFVPHVTIARMRNPQKFAVHKKKIMKVLSDVEFTMQCSCIRFYAEIDQQKQTPLSEEVFTG